MSYIVPGGIFSIGADKRVGMVHNRLENRLTLAFAGVVDAKRTGTWTTLPLLMSINLLFAR